MELMLEEVYPDSRVASSSVNNFLFVEVTTCRPSTPLLLCLKCFAVRVDKNMLLGVVAMNGPYTF